MQKITLNFLKIILHLVAIFAIIYLFLPIASWYLNFKPLWGVDFHLLSSLTQLLNNNFVLPFGLWDYGWFDGFPIFLYPTLHVYITHFLTQFFGLVEAIQIWMMVSTALFVIGAYFLFFAISR